MKWPDKKRIIILFVFLIIIYLCIHFKFFIPCPILLVTKKYCPGCGITRMFLSILSLDFYQAFRYNPLIFISLPILFPYLLYQLYIWLYQKQDFLIKYYPKKALWILLFIVVIYGVMRNIPYFSVLAPTKIS